MYVNIVYEFVEGDHHIYFYKLVSVNNRNIEWVDKLSLFPIGTETTYIQLINVFKSIM